jgi:hypothetical protein
MNRPNQETIKRKRAIDAAFAFREIGRRCNMAPRFGRFQCRRCSWSMKLRIPLEEPGMLVLEQHVAGHAGEPEQLGLVAR